MKRDFTATCYVICEDKVLLVYHKKLQKWMPPGGHMEPNETPEEAACREVFEETGIKIQLISQENVTVSQKNAKSLMRPYMCLLEEIPMIGETPAHQHIDFIYLGIPIGGEKSANLSEVDAVRWFTKDEVLALKAESDIFLDAQETIAYILTHEVQAVLR